MAIILPPTTDPTEQKAAVWIRAIEAKQPIYPNSPTFPWFRLLMDETTKPGADDPVFRCALRLICLHLPILDRATIWTLFVFLVCTVPSSWPTRLRPLYPNLETSMRTLHALATGAPPPTLDQLAARTRELFNGYLTPPPPGIPLSLIDLNPIRSGYVALRNFVAGT